ncbi:MAG: molybdopterin-dependent oxidoreductase [bacterium]|nr:molybdopterin-dependent oxidoreductase [candidate division KSB1 bacterium]MDH7559762.1 molybdopterin-dependent oxidoreductase [bacterium]
MLSVRRTACLTLSILLAGLLAGAIAQSGGGKRDVTTMAAPRGSRLRPADKGPVRSALGVPKVDLSAYRLTVTGGVDSSLSLDWEQILQLPAVYSDTILLYCVEGWEVWGNWKGILVKDLLRSARPRAGAKYVAFHCMDGYTTCLPLDYVEKQNVLLAFELNGKRLRPDIGFPLRLVAFGKYGYKWAKWVDQVILLRQPTKGYWEKRGYSDEANVPLERRRFYEGQEAKPGE